MFELLLDAAPAIKRVGRGWPRRRPERRHAENGYDNRRCRSYLHRRRIKAWIARRGMASNERLGRHRWVVERPVAWTLDYTRLGLRYDCTEKAMTALLALACAYTCWKVPNRRSQF